METVSGNVINMQVHKAMYVRESLKPKSSNCRKAKKNLFNLERSKM